jgi:uncharacterized protein (TIGR01244 family)
MQQEGLPHITRISPKLSVTAQPELLNNQVFRKSGFSRLINNRPEGEEQGQPTSAEEQRAAIAAGMTYAYIPVTLANITEADVRAFQRAVAEVDGQVIAHCRTGVRSASLHLIGEVLDGRLSQQDIAVKAAELGLNLSGAATWLEHHKRRMPIVDAFYDSRTGSVQYVVSDPTTMRCAVIDPVLDFDEKSGSTATTSADAILRHVTDSNLTIDWILDSHPHADHLSAAVYLKRMTGAPIAIGAKVVQVQELWQSIYNIPGLATDGSQWDRLFTDGEQFKIGSVDASVLFSPGHTPASTTYVIGDAAFVHDTLFMPDAGTARADFPGGDAAVLWDTIQGILSMPEDTRLYTGHDYPPGGRSPRWESTVKEQKARNIHIVGLDREGFIALRKARDQTLAMPKLMLPALQVNINAGHFPDPEDNSRSYLKIPLDAFPGFAW